MNLWLAALIAFVCYVIGFSLGRSEAHSTIARECERLGGFYVGKKIYKCTLVTENKTEESPQ